MIKGIIKETGNYYQCKECKLVYKDKNWAEKCEEWCKKNRSCNLEITKHATNIKMIKMLKKNSKNLDKETKTVRKRYDRLSRFYDWLEKGIEKKHFAKWRKNMFKGLRGKILEIGVGTGKNLPYYRKEAYVIGIELSARMLKKAREKLKKLRNKNIKLMQMDAQKLRFRDNSFDYVVCTFVLCSVPDPVKTLKEMGRVCKKNGNIVMIEHVLSDNMFIAFFLHIHNPITRTLFGFNVNRKTSENIKKAGLKIKNEENLGFFDVFRKIEIINTK